MVISRPQEGIECIIRYCSDNGVMYESMLINTDIPMLGHEISKKIQRK